MRSREKAVPLGLYLHIPFCPYRCPYCDFSIVVDAKKPSPLRVPYLDLLKGEVRGWGTKLARPVIHSLFLGGGTPSLLTVEEVAGVMDAVRSSFRLREAIEITLEANPETVSPEQLRGYRGLGINRLSIGAQTFDPRGLKVLGRGHGPDQIGKSVQASRDAGFDNLSLDLIYGWQDQTLREWRRDLEQALALQPEHLSLYALTVEAGTILSRQIARGRFSSPSDDLGAGCFTAAHNLLEARGYRHYEISNYARAGYESAHNLGYWRYHEYLGLGLGASSFLKGRADPEPGLPSEALAKAGHHGLRWTQSGVMKHYLEARGAVKVDPIDRKTAMGEFMMVGLRLMEGVDAADFKREFGSELEEVFGGVIGPLMVQGLLHRIGNRIACTGRGFLFHDSVATAFLVDH